MTQDLIAQARATYSVDYWSDGYFDINAAGEVILVNPDRDTPISLVDVVAQAQRAGLALPLLVRFGGLLQHRVRRLCQAFAAVMDEQAYAADYTCVYPIKVNQQSHVVEEINTTNVDVPRCAAGMEAGSKPELMAILALSEVGDTIVCNGYKDRAFLRLALMGEKLGRRVYIVVEKFSELALILQESANLGIRPRIGLRARLSSVGAGNWQNTGGEKSKFGLSAGQILQVVEQLASVDMLDCLSLLHFHLGSQVSNIRDIQNAMKEASRYFVELRTSGAAIDTVDVGGGLGVDYEGTRTRSYCSVNYSIHEYAASIVAALKDACDAHQLAYPHIITESGRAITAHHAVLITNVIGRESPLGKTPPKAEPDEHAVLRELRRCYEGTAGTLPITELYHELVYRFSEANDMYNYGVLGLREKAVAEHLYFATCERIRSQLSPTNRVHHQMLVELNEKLADKVFLNFSLFQSLPDIWGIDQVFPIMPIERLNTPLSRFGVIQDITCDSDGRIDRYVDCGGLSGYMALPDYDPNDNLMFGFFMVGAYQEILGDMHNLFGDTDSVVVGRDDDGKMCFSHTQKGDTVGTVLRYVNFEPLNLQQRFHQSLLSSGLSAAEQSMCLAEFMAGLGAYTYLG